ncbi:MAG TPA: hypothetical protein P5120_12570 [Spirochaetota bacterium]|nr:hypothetical protein [Spirochaetota bacterium]HPF07291.1 hypothetical protein [Spirochaetota bacterium]HPJ42103.1 hypothetical protein [Spirochaetota bacterium]HPR38567.1 hypothetical protein [Spirochaetota bacterium]HRX48345.1 hypothetical protein [Spirochaetota bacterium]
MNEDNSNYQKSIALMCRDFLCEMDEFPEFTRENDLLDRITSAILNEGDEDLFHIRNLESHIFKYSSKLLALYSRHPDNPYLDKLYRRSESLREMCQNLLRDIL